MTRTANESAAEQSLTRRTATHRHATNETEITVTIDLDGAGEASINTGIGFLDHLLTALVRHSGVDCTLTCRGDLQVDDHHTAEDRLRLGTDAPWTRPWVHGRGFARFGSAYAPLDESLARGGRSLGPPLCSGVPGPQT